MNSIKSVELAKIARNHPDYSLCVALNVSHPYNNGTYKRRLVAAGIVDIFADRDIQNSHTFSDHREATEFMFCLGETNSAYDVHPRIRELEATTLAFLYSFELEGMISEGKLSEAKEVLNQRLPEVLGNPVFCPTHDSPFSEHAEFLSLCDLDIAVSVGVGDLNNDEDELRIFGEKPHTVSVDTDAKIITLEFDVLDDNHEGLKRVNALEKQLEKLISTTVASKHSKPHATQVKMAHKLLARR